MAGTLEIPVEGNANTTEDPKVKAGIKRLNELLEGSNLVAEAGLGTASVGSAKLAASAKELFPQLSSATKRVVNFGESSVTFSASTGSAVKEVTHGLGVKPIAVKLTIETADEGLFTPRLAERTATVFKFAYRCDGSRTGTFTVLWEAIG